MPCVSQARLLRVVTRELTRQKAHTLNVRQFNAVVRAVNDIVQELADDHRPAAPGSGIDAWLASDDTGLSSEVMAHHLAPLALGRQVDADEPEAHPLDPADLGRCLSLLDAAPELRRHLPAMAAVSPVWAGLVAAWDELEALYREEAPTGTAPKCYARMAAIRDAAGD